MDIYNETDYRVILKNVIKDRKKLDPGFNFKRLSEATQVQKSYLSKVLNGAADLNSDQLYLACHFLEFDMRQKGYMELLLEYARTGLANRSKVLLKRIQKRQIKQLQTKQHLTAKTVEPNDQEVEDYYLDPLHQVVHVCLSIPRYQNDIQLLCKDLQISKSRMLAVITKLEQIGFIDRTAGKAKMVLKKIHLSPNSKVYKAWRRQLRSMGSHKLDNLPNDQSYSFSVVFSGNDESRKKIQTKFLAFLEEVETIAENSKEDHTYQMNFDLFPWTYTDN